MWTVVGSIDCTSTAGVRKCSKHSALGLLPAHQYHRSAYNEVTVVDTVRSAAPNWNTAPEIIVVV